MSKSSSATPLLAAVGVGAALLALNLLFAPDPPPMAPGPAPAPGDEAAPTPGPREAEAPEAGAPEERPPREGPDRSRSVSLPGPAESGRAEGGQPAAEAASTPGAAPGQVEPEQIRDAVQAVTPGIQECMEAWWEVDPELEGRLVMDFTLTPAGLGEVLVLEHDDVPFGVQTCFASAIYEADWPRPATGELQVTYPFLFTPDDPEADPPAPVDTGA